MPLIDIDTYAREWLKRATRSNETVDEADKFISLWIAFNGWMRKTFGENSRDTYLIGRVKGFQNIKRVFDELKLSDGQFSFNLETLGTYTVANMKFVEDTNEVKRYNGTFESLIDVIYQVRCNLFHGRKNPTENKKDYELVCLSYYTLLPLFRRYVETNPL